MIHDFFTIWVCVLIIFHNFTQKIFSLSFLTFIVMFMGLYFSYVNPRKYYIEYNDKEIIIDGYSKYAVDILLHILPFVFIYFNYGIEPFFNNWKIIPSLLLIILYNLIYCLEKVYRLPKQEITFVSIVSFISYFLISNYMN
jgi:hypothetical protein